MREVDRLRIENDALVGVMAHLYGQYMQALQTIAAMQAAAATLAAQNKPEVKVEMSGTGQYV